MNLEDMSREELTKLQKDVAAALKSFDERRMKEAQVKLESMAAEMGFSLADFAGAKKAKSAGLPPKFVHPENPAKTWSGRGRQPQWFKDAIAAGKTEADLAI
ncbi:trans-acting regulatory protein hvrA [Jannaschia pagri]|uniref:Trans-acting regulatory protein hvrA n=1 Tax=Jannaschia pagri TaxID=2829797 RepID=A0ABQ4NL38_9RHOB|nr:MULTISPECIES: H-NS histone family protein [unclassified Jannaschia]GIT91271.1 trans-acting regulatory protein hvrA [Jannaschia sp. AI_61]GIT95104.1 trans-acting regulatory protein hvrA [Jannaschia sp. AI_62]